MAFAQLGKIRITAEILDLFAKNNAIKQKLDSVVYASSISFIDLCSAFFHSVLPFALRP